MDESPPGARLVRGSIVAGSMLSILVSIALARAALVLGSPAGRWTYEYIEGVRLRPLELLLVAAAVCACALVLAPVRDADRRPWRAVLLWIAAALVVQVLVRHSSSFTLER